MAGAGLSVYAQRAQVAVIHRKSAERSGQEEDDEARPGDDMECVIEAERVGLKLDAAGYDADSAAGRSGGPARFRRQISRDGGDSLRRDPVARRDVKTEQEGV